MIGMFKNEIIMKIINSTHLLLWKNITKATQVTGKVHQNTFWDLTIPHERVEEGNFGQCWGGVYSWSNAAYRQKHGEVQTVSLGVLERKLSSVIMSNDKMWWWQKRWQSQEIQKLQMRWSKQQRQENITDGYSKDKTKLLKHQQQQ